MVVAFGGCGSTWLMTKCDYMEGRMGMPENETELIKATKKKAWQKPGKIVAIVIILLLGSGGYFVYKTANQKEVTYLTLPVAAGAIVDEIQATGTVKPLHEVDLYFRQQGTLKGLYVRNGDQVKAGQVLALQDDANLQAQLEQARSDLLQAQYKLQQSQMECEKTQIAAKRQDELYNQGAIAKLDWEQAQRDYKNALVNVQSSQVAIQTAKAKEVIAASNLKNAALTAPFTGVAAQVNGEVGQETGNSSSPMFHLISNELQVLAMVNEVDIGRIKEKQAVNFTVTAYPGQSFQGTVTRVSPQSTATNNIQQYEVDIATKDILRQLRAGMSVTAKIIVAQRNHVITVPNLAFAYTQTFLSNNKLNTNQNLNQQRNQSNDQRTGNMSQGSAWSKKNNQGLKPSMKRMVVVLQAGKPVIKPITVGLSDLSNTEVIEGLRPGDQVVIGTNDANQNSSTGTGNQQSGSQQRSGIGGGIGGGAHIRD